MQAQTISDFESFDLDQNGFLNGSDGSGGFQDGHIFLPNVYNDVYSFWQGWAISNVVDTTTAGFTNQYGSIVGSGFDGSPHYAVSYAFDPATIRLTDEAIGGVVNGLYVTNATFAFLSVRDGDGFAKKFGGITGNDPDFFKITFKGFLDGQIKADSVDFYLADYRFDNNAQDYIIDEWTYVDLTSLGNLDSLQLSLSSSDNGAFGMNTPAYFCVDQIETRDAISSSFDLVQALEINISISNQVLRLESDNAINYQLFDLNGQQIASGNEYGFAHIIDVSDFPSGLYIVNTRTKEGRIKADTFYKP